MCVCVSSVQISDGPRPKSYSHMDTRAEQIQHTRTNWMCKTVFIITVNTPLNRPRRGRWQRFCLSNCLFAYRWDHPPPSSPSLLPTCSHYCSETLIRFRQPSSRLLKGPAATLMGSQSAPHCSTFAPSYLSKQRSTDRPQPWKLN